MTRLSHIALAHTVFAAGLLSLSAGGFAQPPAPPTKAHGGPGMDRRMKEPETRTELKADLEARFDRMDINHDGKIDEKDAEARHAQRITAMFERIDTDKNGSISKEEFVAAQERRGDAMGPPRGGPDGTRSPGRAMLFDRGGPEGRMHGRMPFAPPPGGFGRHSPDGKPREPLTKAEFVEHGLARFDRIDINHDGKISAAERDAARASMHRPRDRDHMPPPPPTPPQSGQ